MNLKSNQNLAIPTTNPVVVSQNIIDPVSSGLSSSRPISQDKKSKTYMESEKSFANEQVKSVLKTTR